MSSSTISSLTPPSPVPHHQQITPASSLQPQANYLKSKQGVPATVRKKGIESLNPNLVRSDLISMSVSLISS